MTVKTVIMTFVMTIDNDDDNLCHEKKEVEEEEEDFKNI